MKKPVYGIDITVTRSDLPGISLRVDLPEIDRDYVAEHNPVILAIFNNFDRYAGLADKARQKMEKQDQDSEEL